MYRRIYYIVFICLLNMMQETKYWLIYVPSGILKHHKTCKYHQLHPLVAGKQTDAPML